MGSEVRVWFDHRVIATYPPGSVVEYEYDDQRITVHAGRGGEQIGEHRAGEFHTAGTGGVCGYLVPRADCPNCRPP